MSPTPIYSCEYCGKKFEGEFFPMTSPHPTLYLDNSNPAIKCLKHETLCALTKKLQKEIDEIKETPQLKQEPALIQINAPLALTQLELETKISTLKSIISDIQKNI